MRVPEIDKKHPQTSSAGDASIAVGGNLGSASTIYIGKQVLGDGTEFLATAVKNPTRIFALADTASFTGREWLATLADNFMATYSCGYVFVEAAAGMGKTAFAAWLVKTRGCLSHFSRYAGGTTTRAALLNLSAQLVREFGLDDRFPGRVLPPSMLTPDAFESLLDEAADRAAARKAKIVIVIDGMDDAETDSQGLPFGLPSVLPSGVYVIGTYRTGFIPALPDSPSTKLRIDKEDARNLDDIRRFLATTALTDAELSTRLAAAGIAPDSFADVLSRHCDGVWIYARYAIEELRHGLLQPSALTQLPKGLWNYYAEQVRRWKQHPAWDLALLPLTATLAVAGEPLSAQALARLAGNLNPLDVSNWCDSVLRPLLSVPPPAPGHVRCYEIFHASFKEVFDAQPTADWPYDLTILADDLHYAATEAHRRIAAFYLDQFGTLDAGLPVLANNPADGNSDDGYALRHVCRHLTEAGQLADLHRLLVVEAAAEDRDNVNVWYAAHEYGRHEAGYLDDVSRAWAAISESTNAALTRRMLAPALGMEIRYALMTASVANRVSTARPELLIALLRSGSWPLARVLEQVRRLPPRALISCVGALLAYAGSVGMPRDALEEMLDTISMVDDEEALARTLAQLAPSLPMDLADKATRIADTVRDHYWRAWALTGLLPYLFLDQRDATAAAALTASSEIPDMRRRARAQARLAPHLNTRLLTELFAAVRESKGGDDARATALAGIAPCLTGPLLDDARDMASVIALPRARALALASLAPSLSADQQAEVLTQALDALSLIASHAEKADALIALLPRLPSEQLTTALDAVSRIADANSQVRLLRALAPRIQPSLHSAALTAARSIADPYCRAQALIGFLPYLLAGHRPEVASEAFSAAHETIDGYWRARALLDVAPYLSAREQSAAIQSAITATCDIAVGYRQARAIAEFTARFPAAAHSQVLEAVARLYPDDLRAHTLMRIAPSLRRDLTARAMEIARSLPERELRARALIALAPQLPDGQNMRTVAQALKTAAVRPNESQCAKTLARLALHLAEGREEALDRALSLVETVNGEAERVAALLDIADKLPESLHDRAVTIVGTLTHPPVQAHALIGLTPHLSSGLRDRVLTMAIGLKDAAARAAAVAGIAAHLTPQSLARALTAAEEIAQPNLKARALARIAACLAGDQRNDVLYRTLDIINSITDKELQARVLGDIAAWLPDYMLADAVSQAMMSPSLVRGEILHALGPHLPAELVDSAIESASSIANPARRRRALRGILMALPVQKVILDYSALLGTHTLDVAGDEPWGSAIEPSDAPLADSLAALLFRLPDTLFARGLAYAVDSDTRGWLIKNILIKRFPADSPDITDAIRSISDFHVSILSKLDLADALPFDKRLDTLALLLDSISEQIPEERLPADRVMDYERIATARIAQLGNVEDIPSDIVSRAISSIISAGFRWYLRNSVHSPMMRDQISDERTYFDMQRLRRIAEEEERLWWTQIVNIIVHDGYWKVLAFIEVAARMSPDQQHQGISTALSAAMEVREPYWRARALVELINHLPSAQRPKVLAQARVDTGEAIKRLIKPNVPSAANRPITPDVTEVCAAAISRACGTATPKDFTPEAKRPTAATSLWALFSAAKLGSEIRHAEAISRLAQYLTNNGLAIALDAATSIRAEDARAVALVGLAPYLGSDAIDAAFRAAKRISAEQARARALTGLAPYLPQHLLIEALDAAPAENLEAAVAILARARMLPITEADAAFVTLLRKSLDGRGRDACLGILATVTPDLVQVGGQPSIRECVLAVRDVYAWWP